MLIGWAETKRGAHVIPTRNGIVASEAIDNEAIAGIAVELDRQGAVRTTVTWAGRQNGTTAADLAPKGERHRASVEHGLRPALLLTGQIH